MRHEHLAPGAVVLRQFAAPEEAALLAGIEEVSVNAPFRHMITPGGFRMSVGMTNCGPLGWVTDKTGYRYDGVDPVSGLPWPPMPDVFEDLPPGRPPTPDSTSMFLIETRKTSTGRSFRSRSDFPRSSYLVGLRDPTEQPAWR